MKGTYPDPNIGQLLINRYQLVELIGKGSMGRVYRAEDTLLGGVPVAIKFLVQTLLNDNMKTRFAHEARMGAQLGQKTIHVVRVIDYGMHREEVPFYVMEYLEGENLSNVIANTPLPLSRFLVLVRQVCLGLQCAHQGIKIDGKICPIIHRDIKPSNVLVVPDPGLGELAKVLDFGIAKFLTERPEGRQTQAFMGTLAYCSPEQIEGRELDSRSDIYSLGVTMFEMLTGKMPIQAESHTIGSWYKAHHFQPPRTLETTAPGLNVPKALEELIMHCLAKSPSDRPQNIGEVLAALEPLEHRLEVQEPAPAVSPVEGNPALAPPASDPQVKFLSVEEACWQESWPVDKPIAEIVFTLPMRTQKESVAAVWVMLTREEIQKRLLSTRYNHFLCAMAPHPMVLWITAIYDRSQGVRWLPCYLDLKHPRGQETALLLGKTGYYPLIFFALEEPQQTSHVMTLTIAPYQRQLMRDWVKASQQMLVTAAPNVSKERLKAELEKIKPQILQKLTARTGETEITPDP